MKKYAYLILIWTTLLCVSCLDKNLEELETYVGNEITGIQGVYYRYYSAETIPGSGEQVIKQAPLTVSNPQLNVENGTLDFTVSLPSNFPEEEKENVSVNELVVILNISTASLIEPVGNAPILGIPGDWSKPNQYKVTAANGDEKVWTLSLHLNNSFGDY